MATTHIPNKAGKTQGTSWRVRIDGGFWGEYQRLVYESVLPYQWKALNDEIPGAPQSHSIENFRIAAGIRSGRYDGLVFQDSDLAKWLEAAGHMAGTRDITGTELESWINEAVDIIAAAQQPDGYLNTYFTLKDPEHRWANLREAHELYCAGHMIEAAVATYRSTGNEKILTVARRFADLIDSTFGTAKGKKRGYPGHEEVELALVKLYRVTGEKRYLELARYFVDERGASPSYFREEEAAASFQPIFHNRDLPYFQAHAPVREQAEAVGHAVRAVYLYTAMADLALEYDDAGLAAACARLFESAVGRKMYITGGIGASARHESFAGDYDLPNDTVYAETCAAIGLFMFSQRMAVLTNESRFADVMERALHNGIISGLALDGHHYFYVNPLEVVPSRCDGNETYLHVKYRRQPWYGCACCPPNIARTIASLGDYFYHYSGGAIYADLFHSGRLDYESANVRLSITEKTEFPWDGAVTWTFSAKQTQKVDFAVRVPDWSAETRLAVNGKAVDLSSVLRSGYAHLDREWRDGDVVTLTLDMAPRRVYADPRVSADAGRVAVGRGPMIYCLEEEDNATPLSRVSLPAASRLDAATRPDLFGGVVAVRASGFIERVSGATAATGLYGSTPPEERSEATTLTFIPYYAWANRKPGEMTVWIRERT